MTGEKAEMEDLVNDIVMDIKAAHQWLNDRGYGYTTRQVTRMAHERKLPFKHGPDGHKLFIWRSQLERAVLPEFSDKAA